MLITAQIVINAIINGRDFINFSSFFLNIIFIKEINPNAKTTLIIVFNINPIVIISSPYI